MPLVIGHVLEDVGDVVAELASGERLNGDARLSWSCFESLKSKLRITYCGKNGCMHSPW